LEEDHATVPLAFFSFPTAAFSATVSPFFSFSSFLFKTAPLLDRMITPDFLPETPEEDGPAGREAAEAAGPACTPSAPFLREKIPKRSAVSATMTDKHTVTAILLRRTMFFRFAGPLPSHRLFM
jgi:hypothetical protein